MTGITRLTLHSEGEHVPYSKGSCITRGTETGWSDFSYRSRHVIVTN